MSPTAPDRIHKPWRYRLVAGGFRYLFRLFFFRRIHLHDFDLIPADGPLLVACNHLSNLDPLLMGAFFPRTLHAMAKKELFANHLVGWVLQGCNTFPVDRGSADRGALRQAFDVLRGGGRLMIFVEGTRAPEPGMKRAESGVGFLHRRSTARVLPVAIWGSERAMRRGSKMLHRADIHIRVGRDFDLPRPPGRGDDQATADAVAAAIATLLPLEYRGAYAASDPGRGDDA